MSVVYSLTQDPGEPESQRFHDDTPSTGMWPNIRAIQEAISLESYLTQIGVQIRNGRCACPVHGGSNPSSFKLLGDVAHCHSCQWSGGVVKLHAALEGVEFWEAFVDLSTRYGIKLPGRPDSWYRKNERQQPIRDAIEEMKVRRLQRFLYKMVEPYVTDAADAENTWRECEPLASLWLARMQGEATDE